MKKENSNTNKTKDINYEPLLAAALSKEQKRELLERVQFMKALNTKQIRALIWWNIFNPKKVNKFYEMLQIGKAARFAFEDAQRCC